MKVNKVSANQSFGALKVEACCAHYKWIKSNVVPKLGKDPIIEMLDKIGLDVLIKDTSFLGEEYPLISVVGKGNPKHCRFVDTVPLTQKGGSLTKRLAKIPRKIKTTAIDMIGGSKDYFDALLNDTLRL